MSEQEYSDFDDVWGSDGEVDETKKVRDVHYKQGYVDGITSAKDDNLQQGFNETYLLGSKIGLDVGAIIGKFQMLVLLYGTNNETLRVDYQQAMKDLKINNVLSKNNFDDKAQKFNRETLEKWEKIIGTYGSEYNLNLGTNH